MRQRRFAVRLLTMVLVAVCYGVSEIPAQAQGTVGVRAGASLDPDQFFFGGHVETSPLIARLHFRPNVEIGFGEDLTLIALNFEFAYRFTEQGAWQPYAGAGPSLNLSRVEDDSNWGGGFNFFGGVEHQSGVFVEAKFGVENSADFKFMAGYRFGR